MEQPKFPEEFVKKHCPQVMGAASWRRNFNLPQDAEDDRNYAACAFHSAGAGMECESCELFLTRPMRTKAEKDFLVEIEQFYKDMAEYEKYQKYLNNAKMDIGSGI